MPLQGEYAPPAPAEWVREQVETWERTGGREGTTHKDTGLPVVIVVNRGAKSGQLHRTPLMRVEHDGDYLAVGSKGGAPENPAWVNNIRTHPEVEVWDGTERRDYTVREVHGEERDQWWERAVAAYPPYAEYQTRTDRLIPLFVLEPVGS
ncbi:MAG TPA: nitroreductase family deazaflavin-dependent oxidoreductase [Solirubrobacteraceae bacterium]|jgi:deazaflavin-dependent oxidoreductase (nitroreductase family)|nr:nitroreductase family deazaflavin-dependent oxidoreductase [Solirubrobacteraceae bacterium]